MPPASLARSVLQPFPASLARSVLKPFPASLARSVLKPCAPKPCAPNYDSPTLTAARAARGNELPTSLPP